MDKPLLLSFSPCPNDTFMFDAMIHHKIDTEGLRFEVSFHDIETLNQHAIEGRADITKLSTKALSLVLDRYIILNSGGAVGFGVGPLLLARHEIPDWQRQMGSFKIGIPGWQTTANFLLEFAFPEAKNKHQFLFSEIESNLLSGQIEVGLVIHESRFTYQKKGLVQLMDLGAYWEKKTGLPIPLAAIAVKRTLPVRVQQKLDRVLKKSLEFAFLHPDSSLAFTQSHAQEMEPAVVQQHISLYVNAFSLDLGAEGKLALSTLLDSFDNGHSDKSLFVGS